MIDLPMFGSPGPVAVAEHSHLADGKWGRGLVGVLDSALVS